MANLAVFNMPIKALRRSAAVTSPESFRLGATASTMLDDPYHVARRFASLDQIRGGRAGWNIVMTSNPDAAPNFGRDSH
jgi:N-acetyl-S-(2-succino)cysteine monooxygenase